MPSKDLDKEDEEIKLNPNHAEKLRNFLTHPLSKADRIRIRNEAHWNARKYYSEAHKILRSHLNDLERKKTEDLEHAKYASTFERSNKLEEIRTYLTLGKLILQMEEYQASECYLLKALKKYEGLSNMNAEAQKASLSEPSINLSDTELASIYANLGVVEVRKEDFKQAAQHLQIAHSQDIEDLTIWSNLAEVYVKLEQLDSAESEYQKILKVTPYHLDSQIGLGETYVAMGDAGDADFYGQAIKHFTRAIQMSKSRIFPILYKPICSKRLKKKELAAVFYSRGYARVQQYEQSKLVKDTRLLNQAVKDFRNCLKHNPEHHKAKRAIEKIQKTFARFSPQRLVESVGPPILFSLSVFVFALSQYGFWWSNKLSQPSDTPRESTELQEDVATTHNIALAPQDGQKDSQDLVNNFLDSVENFLDNILNAIAPTQGIKEPEYILLTFGSLTFIVVSLYLPQLLTLKIAGIELEKSTVDQIQVTGSLGITK